MSVKVKGQEKHHLTEWKLNTEYWFESERELIVQINIETIIRENRENTNIIDTNQRA